MIFSSFCDVLASRYVFASAFLICMTFFSASGYAQTLQSISPEALPAKFKLDGNIAEWTGMPVDLVPLGTSSGTSSGTSPSTSGDTKGKNNDENSNVRAKVWFAADANGLYIAGSWMIASSAPTSGNDANQPPRLPNPSATGSTVLAGHHLAIALDLPAPHLSALPPISYINRTGIHMLPDVNACQVDAREPLMCERWWQEQDERRRTLPNIFSALYILSPAGIDEIQASVAARSLLQVGRSKTNVVSNTSAATGIGTSSQVKFVAQKQGYTFEARIGVDAFPATAQWPLASGKLTVQMRDGAKVSFTSGTRALLFPASLQQRNPQNPDPLSLAIGVAQFFYFPAVSAAQREAYALYHGLQLYQDTPHAPSPDVIKLPLQAVPERGKLGNITIYEVVGTVGPLGIQNMLMAAQSTEKGIKWLGSWPLAEQKLVGTSKNKQKLLFWLAYKGAMYNVGTGPCESCQRITYRLVSVDPNGVFHEECMGEIVGDTDPTENIDQPHWSDLDYEVTGGGNTFLIKGQVSSPQYPKRPARLQKVGHLYDVGRDQCVPAKP